MSASIRPLTGWSLIEMSGVRDPGGQIIHIAQISPFFFFYPDAVYVDKISISSSDSGMY